MGVSAGDTCDRNTRLLPYRGSKVGRVAAGYLAAYRMQQAARTAKQDSGRSDEITCR